MKHIAAYALLVLGGKSEPTAKEVEKVVKDAGATPDSEAVKKLCDALKGRKFEDLVAEGTKALGAMGGASAPAATGGEAAGGAAAKEAPKEAEKEESEEMDLGGGLFGDDDEY